LLVIAHRGASAAETENSLAAFRAAMNLGADAVELDAHATADGSVVVHHDATVGDMHIPTSPLELVRQHRLSNGEQVPTLSEVLDLFDKGVMVFVEVKTLDADHQARFLEVLASGPAPENYHVHSFDHRIVHRLLKALDGLVGGVLSTSYPLNPLIQLEQSGATELWQSEELMDDELVAAVHAFGAKIIPWTVNDPARMEEFVDMGVDGICTNYPDRLRKILS
jgi:glycerophosphoryl diester phosphodiesterase